MRTKIGYMLLALAIATVSCNKTAETDLPAVKTIDVSIGSGAKAGIDIESRTSLGDDGTVAWETDDKILLWAANEAATMQFSALSFKLYHYNPTFSSAKFTGSVPVMPAGTYTYYALAPEPTSLNATTATYDIPAVQDGSYHEQYDIMMASTTAPALQEGDNSEAVNFKFAHKTHIIKIRIPSNELGEEITGIELTFPTAVVGSLAVDVTNPAAAPVLTNGSNTLTLEFAEPKAVGAIVYAQIAPISLAATDTYTIKAIGSTCEASPNELGGKEFAAGSMTQFAYNVPTPGVYYTRLTFSLPADKGTNTLGETVTGITLTAPAGSTFDNGSNIRTFAPNANGSYTLVLKPKEWTTDNLSGKSVTVAYESENAIVGNTITMPQISINNVNTVSLSVPYLFEENFNTVQTYSDHEDTSGANKDPDAIWIPGLSGWSAARTGGSAGNSVRIVGHREGGMWVPADYEARMDSAPMTNIKGGKTINVKISFNYSGGTNKGAPKFKYGTSTATGLINGASNSIANQAGDISANTSGSYTNVNQSITPFTASATNATRIAWVAYGNDSIPFTLSYYYYYIYIDNIKVSISK